MVKTITSSELRKRFKYHADKISQGDIYTINRPHGRTNLIIISEDYYNKLLLLARGEQENEQEINSLGSGENSSRE